VYCIIGIRIVFFDFRVVCGSVYLILLSSTEGFTQKCYLYSEMLTLTPTPSRQWHLVCKSVNKISYFYEIVSVPHPSGGGRNSLSVHTGVFDDAHPVIKEKYL